MAFQTHTLPLPSCVPRPSTILQLLIACSQLVLFRCSASGSDQNYFEPYTLGSPFNQTDGLLFLANNPNSTTIRRNVSGGSGDGLGSYIGGTSSHNPAFNLSDKGWFFLGQPILLWKYMYSGDGAASFHEASFNMQFSMSIYHQPENNQTKSQSSLVFAIHPALDDYLGYPVSFPPDYWSGSGDTSSGGSTATAGHVSAQIATFYGTKPVDPRNASLVQIDIGQPSPSPAAGNSSSSVGRSTYSVWIDYNHVKHSMSVSVDTIQGPDSTATANGIVNLSNIMTQFASLGFYSSMGQLIQLDTWSLTGERLPYSDSDPWSFSSQRIHKYNGNGNIIILSSVLGSAAAVAITAAIVYLYFNSKYRRWKKEQDKLAKTMQRLPGVPTQVDYADIRKATKNFHDTMKLGKGGFGAVYRCTLPAASLRTGTGPGMEVAVKKFTRDVEDGRYNDFLAEVSIINRLRHKNIVPLVGWSYNKGEPLLIYEYMTNGSLDQHLFQRGSSTRQQEDTSLGKWRTRYNIARDIATGLHYVHHEHEPMVLHRDIKASNIMLDSAFRARLGDFGIACTVAVDRSSFTGIAGTFGYIGPDYAMRHKATRQTDIYAFGVLILEIVTGKKNGDVAPADDHITDWVWRLHREGKLLEAAHAVLTAAAEEEEGRQQVEDDVVDEAKRLLLLGLACTNPNPSDRPSMVEVVQVLTKSAPAPDVPLERPAFVWPPNPGNSVYSTARCSLNGSSASATGSTFELWQII